MYQSDDLCYDRREEHYQNSLSLIVFNDYRFVQYLHDLL